MFSKTWFFRNFPASDGSDFYSTGILHHNIILFKKKKKKNFCRMCFQKTRFFRDFPTLDGSRIYSTPREDLDGPLHKRKTKSKKKNFRAGKGGGVPLT